MTGWKSLVGVLTNGDGSPWSKGLTIIPCGCSCNIRAIDWSSSLAHGLWYSGIYSPVRGMKIGGGAATGVGVFGYECDGVVRSRESVVRPNDCECECEMVREEGSVEVVGRSIDKWVR